LPRISIVTLASNDLNRSLLFYGDGFGLPSDGIAAPEHGGNHVAFYLDGMTLVLFNRAELDKLAPGGAPAAGGAILTLQADSRHEVDALLGKAVASGGLLADEATEEEFGYHGHVRDPDGHLWEVVWFKG
jgi:predicted lactoylglutathione lyase